MRSVISTAVGLWVLSLTSMAAAAPQYDFTARLLNVGTTPIETPALRLVSVLAQDSTNLNVRGSVTVHFTIHSVGSRNQPVGDPLFDGEATLSAGQTSVVTGAPNAGRIELTYDPTTDRLEAQFSVRLKGASPFSGYEIVAYDGIYSTKALIFGALA